MKLSRTQGNSKLVALKTSSPFANKSRPPKVTGHKPVLNSLQRPIKITGSFEGVVPAQTGHPVFDSPGIGKLVKQGKTIERSPRASLASASALGQTTKSNFLEGTGARFKRDTSVGTSLAKPERTKKKANSATQAKAADLSSETRLFKSQKPQAKGKTLFQIVKEAFMSFGSLFISN